MATVITGPNGKTTMTRDVKLNEKELIELGKKYQNLGDRFLHANDWPEHGNCSCLYCIMRIDLGRPCVDGRLNHGITGVLDHIIEMCAMTASDKEITTAIWEWCQKEKKNAKNR